MSSFFARAHLAPPSMGPPLSDLPRPGLRPPYLLSEQLLVFTLVVAPLECLSEVWAPTVYEDLDVVELDQVRQRRCSSRGRRRNPRRRRQRRKGDHPEAEMRSLAGRAGGRGREEVGRRGCRSWWCSDGVSSLSTSPAGPEPDLTPKHFSQGLITGLRRISRPVVESVCGHICLVWSKQRTLTGGLASLSADACQQPRLSSKKS